MNNFSNALEYLLPAEGGYSDRENDNGGVTQLGVTQTTYNTAIQRGVINPNHSDVTYITHSDAVTIQKSLLGCSKS